MALLENTSRGLYCATADVYIDPWQPVARAIVTHAHGDHARPGSQQYLTAAEGVPLLRERIGRDAAIEGLPFGETVVHNGVRLSLHPAGHILGSAQVRIEFAGEIAVVSGDYKVAADPTCRPWEPVPCHTFVSESTFGLPVYRWPLADEIFDDLNAWWKRNQQRGRTSIVYAYSLGKAQRLLAGLQPEIGPILVHGAVDRFLPIYRAAGVTLPPTQKADQQTSRSARGRALVVAPPSAAGSPWMRKFGPVSTAMASGWMQLRGTRRRRAVDRGFALSDHADWNGLLTSIAATGAETIWVTHGYTGVMARWLTEQGKNAQVVATQFEGELEDEPLAAEASGAEHESAADVTNETAVAASDLSDADASAESTAT